jgi:hypothetical protein
VVSTLPSKICTQQCVRLSIGLLVMSQHLPWAHLGDHLVSSSIQQVVKLLSGSVLPSMAPDEAAAALLSGQPLATQPGAVDSRLLGSPAGNHL